MDALIYLIYPALLLYLLWGAKVCKKGEWNEEVMGLSQTKMLQGFIVVIVMFHHLSQKVSAYYIDPIYYKPGMGFFVDLGYFCVSVFLFCSGYGLFKSFQNKEGYLQGFFGKRVAPIILTFYTSEILYLLVRLGLQEKMDLTTILLFLSGIRQSNPNAWYSISLPLFYGMFYLAFRFCKSEGKAILATWLMILAYTLIGTCIDHNDYLMCGEWWYNSAHLFPLGMWFAKNQEKICEKIKKHYSLYLILSLVLTILFFYAALMSTFMISYYYGEGQPWVPLWETVWRRWVCLLLQVIASTLFVAFTVIARMKLRIGNRALSFMGGLTLEFYLIHGLFVHALSFSFANVGPVLYYIRTPILYVLVVTVLSVLAALPYKKLNGLCMKLLCRKN